jgi:hypothetical protein
MSSVFGTTALERKRALLVDPDTYATTMFVIAVDTFGPECLYDAEDPERGPWHPATFKSMLEEHFGVTVPKGNLDRLLAAITIVTTDIFFHSVDRFIVLANVLAGDTFDPMTFEIADTAECAWAITEALILDPPDEETEVFADDIRHYIGFILDQEGYIEAPDVLKIALNANKKDSVRYGFSDDPEMFQAIYDVQKGKTEDIVHVIRDGLLALRQQLQALRLQSGTTDEIVQRLGQMLELNTPEELTGPEQVLK